MTALLPRVIFDTNIFIRSFLNPLGPSGKCFELARKKKVMLCVSDDVFFELEEVLDRPYIRKTLGIDYAVQKEQFLREIELIAYFTDPVEAQFELVRDPDDEFVINLAISSDAGYVVTFDNDLLDLMTATDLESKQFRQKFRNLNIVRPDEFLSVVQETVLSLKP